MIKDILTYPNPILRKKAQVVLDFDDNLKQTITDMIDTMIDAPGVGLAAPQIGVSQRIIIVTNSRDDDDEDAQKDIETDESNNRPMALINPKITSGNGSEVEFEGCLSVPEFSKKIKRFVNIRIKAFDPDGNPIEFEAHNFFARVVQHEIDHLDGILFVDRMSFLTRNRYKKIFKFKTIRANKIPNL